MKQNTLKFDVQLSGLLRLLSFTFLMNKMKGCNLMISSSSLNNKQIEINFIYLAPSTLYLLEFVHKRKQKHTATFEES